MTYSKPFNVTAIIREKVLTMTATTDTCRHTHTHTKSESVFTGGVLFNFFVSIHSFITFFLNRCHK